LLHGRSLALGGLALGLGESFAIGGLELAAPFLLLCFDRIERSGDIRFEHQGDSINHLTRL
jgi:hypothetical protein